MTKRLHTILSPATFDFAALPAFVNGSKTVKRQYQSLVTIFTAKQATQRAKGVRVPGNYVSVPSQKLKKVSPAYRRQMEELAAVGLLEINDSYSAQPEGKKGFCKSIRLAGVHRRAEVVKTLTAARKRRKDAIQDSSLCETAVEEYLAAVIRRVDVDAKEYAAILNTAEPRKAVLMEAAKAKYDAGVANLKRGKKSRRIFSLFTSTPKIMRSALRLDGERLVEIDVRSAQPAILTTMATGEEQKALQALCNAGRFYTFSPSASDKDKNKQAFGRWIGKSRRRSKFVNELAKAFPVLHATVQNFTGPQSLACHLQNVEAEIVIGRVVPRLMAANIPVLTLHDAVSVRASDAEVVAAIVKEEFSAALCFPVAVNVK